MWNGADAAYLAAITAPGRSYTWRGALTDIDGVTYNFTAKDIVQGSGQISRRVSSDTALDIGTVYTSELTIRLYLSIDRYKLYNGTITLYCDVDVSGTTYSVPMGIYTISSCTQELSCISITAYDAMAKLDAVLVASDLGQVEPYTWIAYFASRAGVTLGTTQQDIEDRFPNGQELLSFKETDTALGAMSCRQALSYICACIGANAYIGRDGLLYIGAYASTAVDDIAANERLSSSIADYTTKYTSITLTFADTEETDYYNVAPDDGLTFDLGINPWLQYIDPADRARVCTELITMLSGIAYVPYTMTMMLRPELDPMDVLTLSGNQASSDLGGITSITYKLSGAMTVKCSGGNPRLAQATSKTEKTANAAALAAASNRASIKIESDRITSEVSRATDEEGRLSTLITQTAGGLQIQINEIYSELDGETQLYYTQEAPTLLNYPAWDFTYNIPCNNTVQLRNDLAFEYTDDYYRKNLRAIAYDEVNSRTYRFIKSGGVYYWDEVSDTETSLILSRLSTLEATTEGIQTEVSQVEANLSNNYYTITQTNTKFTQTNDLISQEATRATTAENSKIAKTTSIQTVADIQTDAQNRADAAAVSAKNASIAKTGTYQNAESIVSAAVTQAATDAGNTYIAKTLQLQTADAIVSAAESYTDGKLTRYSTISQTSDAINLGVQSANNYTDSHAYAKQSGIAINASGIEISGSKYIKIKSGGTFSVDSGKFSIDSSGNVSLNGAVTATSGKIGSFEITSDGFRYYYSNTGRYYGVVSGSAGAVRLSSYEAVTDIRGSSISLTTNSSQGGTDQEGVPISIVGGTSSTPTAVRIGGSSYNTSNMTISLRGNITLTGTTSIVNTSGTTVLQANTSGITMSNANMTGTVKVNNKTCVWERASTAYSSNYYVLCGV